MTVNPLLIDFVGALIRFALTTVFAWFISKGILTAEQTGQYMAALTSATFIVPILLWLGTFGWSLYNKYGSRLKLLTALTLPAGSTEATVDKHVEAGMAPAATTPKTSPPAPADPVTK